MGMTYVISEERLKQIKDMIFHEDEVKFEKLSWKILSNPLQQELKKERERVLDELERIAQHNWEEIETDEGEIVRMCFCGELIGKIEELRGEP
jgi:uncharacterized membrane-anchored protein YjiN (DUF445 family)